MLATVLCATFPRGVAAASFTPGDLYTTANQEHGVVSHYSSAGKFIGKVALPVDQDVDSIRGVAFGPDGLLYVVTGYDSSKGVGAVVVAVNALGELQDRYEVAANVTSSIASGDIAFDTTGHFYVAAFGQLLRFTTDDPVSIAPVWHTAAHVYGVSTLPTGNLIAGTDSGVFEVDPTNGTSRLVAATSYTRGVAYDPIDDSVLVSTFGVTGISSQVRRFDRSTTHQTDSVEFANPLDLCVSAVGTIAVGSYGQTGGFLNQNLDVIGSFDNNMSQDFVTVYVPEPATLAVAAALFPLMIRRNGAESYAGRGHATGI